jgi:hypothetical protein
MSAWRRIGSVSEKNSLNATVVCSVVCSVEATNPVLLVLNLYKVSPNDSYDKNQKAPPTPGPER